jgi:endoglucanase
LKDSTGLPTFGFKLTAGGFRVRVRSKQYLAVLALVSLVIGIGYALRLEMQPVPTIEPPPADTIVFGVYDPRQEFSDTPNISIEHIFVPWQKLPADLRQSIQRAAARERQLLITIEPWTDAADRVTGGEDLFESVLAGEYDSRIKAICSEFAGAGAPILVRWGHEMEDVTGRYPWARVDAAGYRKAFRSFVDTCRAVAPEAKFVWSPKGERNLHRYYPGDAFVDYVGLSVYTLQAWDIDRYGVQRTFSEVLAEKYARVTRYAKPVIVAEFAIFGDKPYKDRFFRDFRQSLPEFPALVALVYFNDKEPHYWPQGYGSPDWRIMTDHFFRLTTASGVHS